MILEYQFAINLIAGVFLAVAQSIYLIQVLKKQITPSLLTWFGWAILVSVALISQILEYGWDWTLTGHLFSALGCTAIFLAAIFTKNFVMLSEDWRFLYLGLACVALYIIFSDPWLTTIFAILADLVLGIPTLIKGIKSPKTEKSIGWNIALVCWTLTLITCLDNNVIFFLFPFYCLLFNVSMSYLTRAKRILAMEKISTPG
jgi:hypothetical protein